MIAPPHEEVDTIVNEELRIAVEISDSSAKFAMSRKADLYARHGAPEYWIVHREQCGVIRLWSPRDGSYSECRNAPFGAFIEAATIKGRIVSARGIGSGP